MTRAYTPRAAPKRFREGMPEAVARRVLDVFENPRGTVCDYDVVFREVLGADGDPLYREMYGLDFDKYGRQGCHFGLHPYQMAQFRQSNRRRRIAWKDLSLPARAAIEHYVSTVEWEA